MMIKLTIYNVLSIFLGIFIEGTPMPFGTYCEVIVYILNQTVLSVFP